MSQDHSVGGILFAGHSGVPGKCGNLFLFKHFLIIRRWDDRDPGIPSSSLWRFVKAGTDRTAGSLEKDMIDLRVAQPYIPAWIRDNGARITRADANPVFRPKAR